VSKQIYILRGILFNQKVAVGRVIHITIFCACLLKMPRCQVE